MNSFDIVYFTENGRDIIQDWVNGLKDIKTQTVIRRRLLRLGEGNFGENHYCRDGVWELIIDYGSGYRVYYAKSGKFVILLLCGGNKRTQNKDIDRAVEYLQKYKKEHKL